MLTSNHATSCPWKGHPCDGKPQTLGKGKEFPWKLSANNPCIISGPPIDSIYKFPVYSQSQAKKDFVERAVQLKPILDNALVETIKHPLVSHLSLRGSVPQAFL